MLTSTKSGLSPQETDTWLWLLGLCRLINIIFMSWITYTELVNYLITVIKLGIKTLHNIEM